VALIILVAIATKLYPSIVTWFSRAEISTQRAQGRAKTQGT